MKSNQANLIGNQLIIKGKKSPLPIRITLIIILVICSLIPIAATIFLISEKKGPHIGIFFSFLFFWGIGFYLLRIILWNSFGREVVNFEKEKITYVADYRFFKDGQKSISTINVEVAAIPFQDKDSKEGTLIFSNENQIIETVLGVSLEKMVEIAREINNRY